MTYLFIKNQFEREKFVLFSYKIKNFKKTKKPKKTNIFSGFFRWFFFGFFWVGFLMPTLYLIGGPSVSYSLAN
jgi:hypothetical protein